LSFSFSITDLAAVVSALKPSVRNLLSIRNLRITATYLGGDVLVHAN
jgi:hypothetical protein